MKLTLDQVKKAAKLANLPIADDELEKYSGQLSEILDYIDKLNQADTEGVEPTFNVTGLANVMRADEESSDLSQEEALQNVTRKSDGLFITKGVFEEV